jgi:hypothetical protein
MVNIYSAMTSINLHPRFASCSAFPSVFSSLYSVRLSFRAAPQHSSGSPGTSPLGKLQCSGIPPSCAAPYSGPLPITYLADLNFHKVFESSRPPSAEVRPRESVAGDAPDTPAAADPQGRGSPSRSPRPSTPHPSPPGKPAHTSSRQYPLERSVPTIREATSRSLGAAEPRGKSPGWGSESVAPCPLLQPFGFSNLALLSTLLTVTWCCAFRP